MIQKEKELFKSLCSFKSKTFDNTLLEANTPAVLGHLFFNRMQGIAYGTLKNHGLLGRVNREFRNSLKGAYDQNIEKNKSFLWCVQHLQEVLSDCQCKYAMLKGAYLCKYYPDGYRTSNDIDLLVRPKDVTEVGNALLAAGFKQGNIRNGEFEPATRVEIITSKMMRGETVPYIKEVNLPCMRFLEVDINFSLDYTLGDTASLEEMINNSVIEKLDNFQVRTLRRDDFFVHLCSHLYKEATTLPWIEMKRDMTLYKYCDIYMLLNDASKEEVDFLFILLFTIKDNLVTAMGGEVWDDVVAFACEKNLTGIEALSKIPGSAGAAPVQNIGAYGQDVSDTFVSAEVYDTKDGEFKTLNKSDMGFSYRKSILNTTEKGRYFVISISLQLKEGLLQRPFYNSIERYIESTGATDFSPQGIRKIVSEIRGDKLPDPKEHASSGSFFKNVYLDEAGAKAAEEKEQSSYH